MLLPLHPVAAAHLLTGLKYKADSKRPYSCVSYGELSQITFSSATPDHFNLSCRSSWRRIGSEKCFVVFNVVSIVVLAHIIYIADRCAARLTTPLSHAASSLLVSPSHRSTSSGSLLESFPPSFDTQLVLLLRHGRRSRFINFYHHNCHAQVPGLVLLRQRHRPGLGNLLLDDHHDHLLGLVLLYTTATDPALSTPFRTITTIMCRAPHSPTPWSRTLPCPPSSSQSRAGPPSSRLWF